MLPLLSTTLSVVTTLTLCLNQCDIIWSNENCIITEQRLCDSYLESCKDKCKLDETYIPKVEDASTILHINYEEENKKTDVSVGEEYTNVGGNDPANCIFTVDGTDYNLRDLKDASPFHTPTVDKAGYMYSFGMCNDNADTCKYNPCMAAQFSGSGFSSCQSMLAHWEPTAVVASSLTNSQGVPIGISLKIDNGEICGSVPREVIYNLVCDQNANSPQMGPVGTDEPSQCHYTVQITTKAACSGEAPPTPPGPAGGKTEDDDSGLSGGWIFIIILLVTMTVYCCAGAGFLYHKDNDRRGKELIPQWSFWSRIPGLTCIGCKVSYAWCKDKIQNCRGDGEGRQRKSTAI